mmetsp:Transcript_3542/g.10927  ORF Transcript_3542/g.10927 Transcript_3542/m.10927 type:complete len:129 (-) Transcript_3542:515-901(-)
MQALALHPETRAGKTEAHRALLALAAEVNGSNSMYMCKAYYRQLSAPSPHEVAKVGSFVPSLVLCGAGDALIPPEKSRALAELLASASNTARTAPAIHQVPSTSHQLMQEDPPVVNKLIDGFLVSLSG